MSMLEIGIMKSEEVEEVIHLEYDVLGISPFVATSLLPVKRKVVVARVDGKIAGCATLCWNDRFEIASLAVKDEYRGSGVGAAIIEKCFEVAKELGFNSVWLETPENGPVEFYLSHGFCVKSHVRNMYGDGVSGLKMVKHIS